MKKIIAALLSLSIILSLCSCGGNEDNSINIVMPDGAPALVFAKMMAERTELSGIGITYQIVNGADPLKSKVLNGEADLAVMPTNLAALLYNQKLDIKLLSVNVHGSLYVVGKDEITDLNMLKGKTVYNIGQGQVPDLTFKKILEERGIEYTETDNGSAEKVLLKYVASTAELIPLMVKGDAQYGIMGEPAVTQALGKVQGATISLNIQEVWENVMGTDTYPQASLIAKTEIIQKHPQFITELLAELEENTDWLAAAANIETAVTALAAHGSAMAVLNSDVILRSNVFTQSAYDARQSIESFLITLPVKAIGGKLPDEGFYYTNG